MKLVTHVPGTADAQPSVGLRRDGVVVDVPRVAEIIRQQRLQRWPETLAHLSEVPHTMLGLLAAGPGVLLSLARLVEDTMQSEAVSLAGAPWVFPFDQARLRAPLPDPRSIRDFYAFEAHVRRARARRGLEMVPEWYEFPAFYFSHVGAIYGPGDEIPYPAATTALDYELEVACVIGREGMDIREDEAENYIAGYLIMNDWSARDIQQKEMRVGLGPAKAKDFATSLGPWLVTPDELAERKAGPGRYDLGMKAWVNGVLYSQGNFKDIHWSFTQMIARASEDVRLSPGDVIGSGTVGTGCILELGPETYGWLCPGDRVELEIEGLGRLCNTVGPPRKRR